MRRSRKLEVQPRWIFCARDKLLLSMKACRILANSPTFHNLLTSNRDLLGLRSLLLRCPQETSPSLPSWHAYSWPYPVTGPACDPGTCVRSPRAVRRLAELCLVLGRGFSWPPLPSSTTAGSKHQTRGAVPCTSFSLQIVRGGRSDWQNRYRNSDYYSWPFKLTTEV